MLFNNLENTLNLIITKYNDGQKSVDMYLNNLKSNLVA